jgi:hypothetical protein
MILSDKTYNVLKKIALIWLPALAVFWTSIAGIWNWGYAIIGTISAVDTLLGALLQMSSKAHSKVSDGNLVVDKSSPVKDVYSLELETPPEELAEKNSIKLMVVPASSK